MDPQLQALFEQLRDIHQPTAVSWWPPAPGWWLLMGMLVGLSTWAYLRWKTFRRQAFRREALAQLEQAINAWRQSQDDRALVGACARLCRRLALHNKPRGEVSALTGAEWLDLLAQLSPHPLQSATLDALLKEQYRAQPQIDAEALYQDLRSYMQQVEVPRYA